MCRWPTEESRLAANWREGFRSGALSDVSRRGRNQNLRRDSQWQLHGCSGDRSGGTDTAIGCCRAGACRQRASLVRLPGVSLVVIERRHPSGVEPLASSVIRSSRCCQASGGSQLRIPSTHSCHGGGRSEAVTVITFATLSARSVLVSRQSSVSDLVRRCSTPCKTEYGSTCC